MSLAFVVPYLCSYPCMKSIGRAPGPSSTWRHANPCNQRVTHTRATKTGGRIYRCREQTNEKAAIRLLSPTTDSQIVARSVVLIARYLIDRDVRPGGDESMLWATGFNQCSRMNTQCSDSIGCAGGDRQGLINQYTKW